MYFEIKTSLIEKLKNNFPEYQVFFENVDKGSEKYFVVDISSATLSTIDKEHTKKKYVIDIAAVLKEASNRIFADITQGLDIIIRPYFSFADRHITVYEANTLVIDDVLHYGFTLEFTDSIEEVTGQDTIEELIFKED